jgi:hypothetical protein
VAHSVSEALDTDLDTYLDRELFVGAQAERVAPQRGPEDAAAGSMRALLELAESEADWLETLPPPMAAPVEAKREPVEPPLVIPEWMRVEPGSEASAVETSAHVLHESAVAGLPWGSAAGTDVSGMPMTPWSVPVAEAPREAGRALTFPNNLLAGVPTPPPVAVMQEVTGVPAWTPPTAAMPVAPVPPAWAPPVVPMAPYAPQPWGPVPAVERRVFGMRPGAILGAAAVGALAAGLLVVAGLQVRDRVTDTGAARLSEGTASLTGTVATGSAGTQLAGGSVALGVAGTEATGMQPGAVDAQPGIAGTQPGATGTPPGTVGTESGIAGTQPGATGTAGAQPGATGTQLGIADAQSGTTGTQLGSADAHPGTPGTQPGTVATAPTTGPQPLASSTVPGANPGMPQAAASVSGTVLSTAQADVRGAANNLRAPQPTEATVLTGGKAGTEPVREAPVRRTVAKARIVPASTVSEDTSTADEEASTEPSFTQAESSTGSKTRGAKAVVSSTQARPPGKYAELDEDFARQLGFTEDAEPRAATDPRSKRTVYIPPAPDAKEHLTPDDVKQVVTTNQPAITACIRQHAKGTPVEGGGRFLVKWSVLPAGDTAQVSMDTDTLRATLLAHCIEDVVRRWKFPAHRVRMQAPIRFPFVF